MIETEVLGLVYEKYGMASDEFGQYFTPAPVCSLKADMLVSRNDFDEEPYSVADPTCGSGRFLVHARRAIPSHVDVVAFGQDKDKLCAKITTLNLALHNIPGIVAHGDSLSMDVYNVWRIAPDNPDTPPIQTVPKSEWETVLPSNLD